MYTVYILLGIYIYTHHDSKEPRSHKMHSESGLELEEELIALAFFNRDVSVGCTPEQIKIDITNIRVFDGRINW